VFYERPLPARDRSDLFGQKARKIARIKDVEICLLGHFVRTAVWAVLVIGVMVTGVLVQHWLVIGAVAAVLTLGWATSSLRVAPLILAGGGGFRGDDFDEGGSGVREPRRPLPDLPGGTVALMVPHELE
jgi:hypothetical protein